MKIGIDIQGMQAQGSKNRGIGRYCDNLFSKIIELDKKNEYTFFTNSYYDKISFQNKKSTLFKKIQYVPEENSGFNEPKINELIQFFQINQSDLDILHISSPFERYPSAVISRYNPFLNCKLSVTLYDLIPFIFSDFYLKESSVKSYYFSRLNLLKQSDLIFAISENTKIDAINHLGIASDKIVNIGAAASDNFCKIKISKSQRDKVLKKYSISKKFILYTGGIDFRKNIERAIEAFSNIGNSLLDEFNFVIVCKIQQHEKESLLKLSKKFGIENKIILTGFVPDEELNILYNICNLFIFPSLYEGSGLPVLEAMKCGAPVIASNTSSIPELIEKSEFMFDPTNINEITDLIVKALTDIKFYEKIQNNSVVQNQKFTWEKSAKKILESYSFLFSSKEQPKKSTQLKIRPSLAYFSPIPPIKSGISDYSQRLLPILSKYYDVDVFIDQYEPSNEIRFSTNWNHAINFDKLNEIEKYDRILFQMGNSDRHFYMLNYLKKYKNVTVLHDIFLAPMQYVYATEKDIQDNSTSNIENFFNNLIYSHGEVGNKYVKNFKKGIFFIERIFDDLPMIKSFLDDSNGVIVHSDWSKHKIQSMYSDYNKVKKVNHNSYPVVFTNNILLKKKLGFSETDFLIGSFGVVGRTKRLDVILKHIANFLHKYDNVKYLIVGDMDDSEKNQLSEIIKKNHLETKVRLIGFQNHSTYKKYLSIVDIGINLRYPTRGETSGSLSDFLRFGIPTIVSNYGSFEEIPDDCVIKIDVGNEDKLDTILDQLYSDKTLLEKLSKNGKEFIARNEDIENCALDYYNTIESFYNDNSDTSIIKFISRELSKSKNVEIDDKSLEMIYDSAKSLL